MAAVAAALVGCLGRCEIGDGRLIAGATVGSMAGAVCLKSVASMFGMPW
jgi:hypothetical protein